MKNVRCRRIRSLALVFLLFSAAPLWATTITWTNASGGNWSVAANWSPNQVPAAADTALITTPGTYIVNLDENADVTGLTVGGAAGVQTLQVNGNTLTATNATVSGVLTTTNGTLSGAIIVNSGGVVDESEATLLDTGSLSVLDGGVLNVESRFALFGPLTNAGTVNLTNSVMALYNGNGTSYVGGIDNLGAINFYGGNGDQIASFEQNEYLINQGTLNEKASSGTTSINANVGVLMGTYNAALGSTIDFGGGFASNPLTVGAPPTLNGPGQYQFTSGYLLLTEDAISNLALENGILELGPAFQQRGAITNLTLDGATLVGTNQVSGTLTASNSEFSGALTVNSGGVLNESGASVEDTGWLLIMEGGVVNVASRFALFGPLTNAGTVNLTNSTIALYNGNGTSYAGGIDNLGAINFYGGSGDQIASFEQDEYLINQGTFNQEPGAGTTSINANVGVLMGTYNAALGTTIDFGGGFANNPLTVGVPPKLNGPGQYQFTSGYLLLTEDAIPNLALENGILELGPAFQQGGAITNLTLDGATLVGTNQVSGTLTATNSQFTGMLTVNDGGVLNEFGASVADTGSLSILGGGVLNVASRFALFGPITNSGTVNLTNATIALYNGNGTAYLGGINNQGAIDFYGASGDQIASFEQDEYLINQGTINEEAGTGTTSIAANVGVLMGTYNAALGTTIDFGGGFANDPLTVGAPPTLNGPGQYDFTSGYLLLTEDAITNLTLEYGTLELGPAFQQGGAITNLTLDGTTLVGTNQVSGTLTATNSQFSGVLTINSGGVLNESGASIAATGSLTVQGGGLLNVASRFSVFGPLTNAGTINLTNATISVYNANGPLYEGGINNQGAIYFYGAAGDQVTSVEGNEYLINQGTISQRPGTGNSSVDAAIFTDPGTVDSQGGTLTLTSVNSVNLQSSSVLNFGLNSPTDYGMIAIDVNVALSGTVSANFNNDFVPAKGDAFNVLSYPSFSGGFARTNLPAGTTGQGIYSSNMFTLEITGSGTGATNQPILTIARVSTSTVAVSWSTAAGNFNLQTATILPSESWSTITSGITTVGANYVLTTPVSGEPAFFRLQSQ